MTNALQITNVAHKPASIDPERKESVAIHFTISHDSDVSLNIYDDRDLLVRDINVQNVKEGEHVISWKGLDNAGHKVPDEAYKYTIIAKNGESKVEYDVSDYTGNELYLIEDISWSASTKRFKYQLMEPSRVLIRVGFQNKGPLLSSVLDWRPRISGIHNEVWSGMDISGAIDLTKHPKLLISAQAYTLPDNTIVVDRGRDEQGSKRYISSYTWGEVARSVKHKKKKKIFAPYQRSPDTRGDFPVKIILPEQLDRNKKGVVIAKGILPVRLEIPREHRAAVLSQRSEPVFYVDGQFISENEVGFFPITWRLDTSTLNEGDHFLTVNLRGYEGSFGIATTKIVVEH